MKLFCSLLLLVAAVLATTGTRFVQIRKIGKILLQPFQSERSTGHGISSFEAAATSLAATIGTGNIAGVAGAILLGGPGTLLWIWISGLFGMALKYTEVFIAVRCRHRAADGQWRGGPMYLPRHSLQEKYRFLGTLFAVFGLLVSLGMGDLIQVSTVAESVEVLCSAVSIKPRITNSGIRILTGMLTAVLLYGVLSGGIQRIGKITALLVPIMSAVYLLLCSLIMLLHGDRIGTTIEDIFRSAFSPASVLGTGVGIGIRETFRTGISRGIFSHEAGLGTAAIAHSCADNVSAEAQARFGAFEVFFDVLICTMTGLAILVSGIDLPYGNAEINSTLVIDALASCFGKDFSASTITLSMLLFAFTSMTGFALYGSRCAEFLFGTNAVRPFLGLFLLITVVGPLLPRSMAWDVAELLNAYLCIPNLILIILVLQRNRKLRNALRK